MPAPTLPETANPTPETGVSDSLSNRLNSHSPLTGVPENTLVISVPGETLRCTAFHPSRSCRVCVAD